MKLPPIFCKPEFCVTFTAGQTVLKEGEFGDCMLILIEGEVDVLLHDQMLGTFSPVEVFGEMAAIDSQPRSATVIAKTNCKLARIDQARFRQLIKQRPETGIDIMRMLVERIRWMDSVMPKNAAADALLLDKLRREISELKGFLETQSKQTGQWLQRLKDLNL